MSRHAWECFEAFQMASNHQKCINQSPVSNFYLKGDLYKKPAY